MMRILLIALLMLARPGLLQAHETSRASMTIHAGEPDATALVVDWTISLADLDILLDLDRNLDGNLTAAEFDAGRQMMRGLAGTVLSFRRNGQACSPRDILAEPGSAQQAAFAHLRFSLDCAGGKGPVELDYRLFQGLDANHRVLVGIGGQHWLLTPGVPATLADPLSQQASPWAAFGGFVGEGVHHILIGWDHLAFLLTLMIPALIMPGKLFGSAGAGQRQTPGVSSAAALPALAWTVSSFTLAHSVTLGLAATGWIILPSGPVEAVIAASIVVAALLALVGRGRFSTPKLAFGFGLVHGLGFANVMQESGAGGHGLLVGVLGFNVGVELGQLLFVGLLFPVLYMLVRARRIGPWVSPVMSIGLMVVGAVWFAERVGGWEILPG